MPDHQTTSNVKEELGMPQTGIIVRAGTDSSRVELRCEHHNGLLYAVSSEASWVCSSELRPAHAIAGFMSELLNLHDPAISKLMQRWGLYYRERPLEDPV
jgi:hypothetical protein